MIEQTATFQVLVASNTPEAVGYMVLNEPMPETNRARLQADWVAVHDGIPCPRLIVLPHNAKLMMGGQVIQESPFSFDEYEEKALSTCSPTSVGVIDRYNRHLANIVRHLESVGTSIDTNLIDEFKKHVYYGRDLPELLVDAKPVAGGDRLNTNAKVYEVSEIDLTHALLGITSELRELISVYVEGMTTGVWDIPNIMEEGGDMTWYLPLLAKFCRTTLATIAQLNNKKLLDKKEGRYSKGMFTEAAALNRNLKAERSILESTTIRTEESQVDINDLRPELNPIGVRPHGMPQFSDKQITTTLDKNIFHLIRRCWEPLRGVMEEGFYFWDEAGQIGGGPYETQHEAKTKLNQYVTLLNRPADGELDPPPQAVRSSQDFHPADAKGLKQTWPSTDPPEPK